MITADLLTKETFDEARAEAFAEQVVGMLNEGALAVMTSIGHRSGLFDTLADLPPATSHEIAAAAGLDERYVREWLGAMVTGDVVAYDPDRGTYQLPAEHAAYLTRAADADNLAMFAQYIGLFGQVEDQVLDCFRNGGGVPYSAFARFQEVMADESAHTIVAGLEQNILPLVPGLREQLKAGIRVLDVGCGRGRAMLKLAGLFPASRFTGYDLSAEAIADANAEARRRGLTNVHFAVADVADLDEPGAYDLVTAFDAIHDQARPAEVLARVVAALAPGGVFLMVDIGASSHVDENADHPIGPFLYTTSCMHCMTVSLAEGGAGLGAMWGRETAQAMLADAGFTEVSVTRLPHDIQNEYFVARKG